MRHVIQNVVKHEMINDVDIGTTGEGNDLL